jgi:hypothetical protein
MCFDVVFRLGACAGAAPITDGRIGSDRRLMRWNASLRSRRLITAARDAIAYSNYGQLH